MNGPRCMTCGRPILLTRNGDGWVWVHERQPPPSPHRAVPYTIP